MSTMLSTRPWYRYAFALFGVGIFLVSVYAVRASDQAIIVGPDETIHGSLIRVGEVATIEGSVEGDVVIAANSITISGTVDGDVIAIGREVNISGVINGSVRVLAQGLTISGTVDHNVWAGARTFTLDTDSSVGWEVLAASQEQRLAGSIHGSVKSVASSLDVLGVIDGPINLMLGAGGRGTVGSTAKLGNTFNYTATDQQQLAIASTAAMASTPIFTELSEAPVVPWHKFTTLDFWFSRFLALFSLLLVGLVFFHLAPRLFNDVADAIVQQPLATFGRGILFFIVGPCIIFLLLVTMIGLPLAVMIGAIYLFLLYSSQLFIGFTLGRWLMSHVNPQRTYGPLGLLSLGCALFLVARSLPFIGGLFLICGICFALGAVVRVAPKIFRQLA